MSDERPAGTVPEQTDRYPGFGLEQRRLHVVFRRVRVDVRTGADADRVAEQLLHDPEQGAERVRAVTDRYQRFAPRTVHDQRIGRRRVARRVDVFGFHIVGFAEQAFFIEVDQRVDEAPFVGVGAGHQFAFGVLFRRPQPLRLVQARHRRDVGKDVQVAAQRLDAEIRMDVRPGLDQDQVELFLVEHFPVVRVEMDVRIHLLHRLVLQPLGLVPQQRIDIARRLEFHFFERVRRQTRHVPPAVPQTDYPDFDFLHFHVPCRLTVEGS